MIVFIGITPEQKAALLGITEVSNKRKGGYGMKIHFEFENGENSTYVSPIKMAAAIIDMAEHDWDGDDEQCLDWLREVSEHLKIYCDHNRV